MKITMISLVLLLLLAIALGAAIGYFWKKRTEGTWKEDFKAIDKANKSLEKQVKKGEKDVNRLKKKNDSLASKLAEIEATQATKLDAVQLKLTDLEAKYATIKTSEQDYKIKSQQSTTELDRLTKTHAKLNEKYKTDTANLKEWNNDRASFNRQFKDLKGKLKVAEEKVVKLTTKSARLEKEIDENKAFVAKLRSLKAQNAKFKEDLKYWEKKHYDTHHELANLKTKIDGIVDRNQELEMTNQSAAQSNQQMLQKVQEFKTKFVDMNNKYHKLVEARKN